MALRRAKKLELFSISGHVGINAASYFDVFDAIETSGNQSRTFLRGGRALRLRYVHEDQAHRFRLIVYDGDTGVSPLIYNAMTQAEREALLDEGDIIAHITHATVDPRRRLAAVEYSQRGAKAADIARLCEHIYNAEVADEDSLSLTFDRVPNEDFLHSISEFDRIRTAAVSISRPNTFWDELRDSGGAIAAESNAKVFDFGARADEHQSLDHERGIMGLLIEAVRQEYPSLAGASVTGKRPEDAGETTVSLKDFTVHLKAAVRVTQSGRADSEDMFNQLDALIDNHTSNQPNVQI